MKNNFKITLCCVLLSVLTSFACHSINGISKKAILLGLQKDAQHQEPPKEDNVPEMHKQSQTTNITIQNQPTTPIVITDNTVNDIPVTDFSSAHQNKSHYFTTSTPRHIHQLLSSNKTSEIRNQRQTTTKIPDEVAELEEEISAELKSIVNYSREIPSRLMQEQGLIVDEPGLRVNNKVRRSMPPMQPPLDRGHPDDATLEDDEAIKKDWGGDCGVVHWKSCNNITTVGAETQFHPDFPYDPKKNIMTQLDCFEPMKAMDFPWLCLKNGWTVNRCHILCMSKCNRELLRTRNFDLNLLHEGPCKTKK